MRWLVALLVVAGLGAAAWWLADEDGDVGDATTVGDARRVEAPATPLPEGRATDDRPPTAVVDRAPTTLEVEGDEAADEPPPGRTVSGVLLRASDGSPYTRSEAFTAASGEVEEVDVHGASPRWQSEPSGRFVAEGVPVDADRLLFPRRELVGEMPPAGDPVEPDPNSSFLPQLLLVRGHVSVPLPPGEDDVEGLEVTLETGWALRGRVTDRHGVAVAGARVDLHGHTAVSGPDGGYVLHDILLPGGRTKVWSRATAPGFTPGVEELLTPEGHVVVTLDHVLEPGGALEGLVTGRAGRPRAGVEVTVLGATGGSFTMWDRWVRAATTDREGRYRVEGVPPGRLLVEFDAEADPYERWVDGVVVRAGETTRLDVVLDGGGRVSGRLTDEAGRPVPGVAVGLEHVSRWRADADDGGADLLVEMPGGWERPSFRHWEQDADGERTLHRERRGTLGRRTTDADGMWSFDGVYPGFKRVFVPAVPEGFRLPAPRDLLVEAGVAEHTVDLVLPAGLRITGTITDPAGMPLADCSVDSWLRDAGESVEATTDGRGHFILEGLRPGEASLNVSHAEHRSWSGEATAGGAPLRLVLEPKERLHLLVRDRDTRAPVPVFQLIMNAEGASTMQVVEDEEGRFGKAVDGSDPRELMIHADGYRLWQREDARAGETTASAPLEVWLEPEG